jgi:hypothetical protein
MKAPRLHLSLRDLLRAVLLWFAAFAAGCLVVEAKRRLGFNP